MEHITITDLGNGFKKLVPDKAYRLYNTVTASYYSEAITKRPNEFIAVRT